MAQIERAVMQAPKPVGRGAAARKYDLITAMGAFALASDKTCQRLVLRLLTLITARYNWARDELAVGQREIARMWSCDERTVKRELAKLRAIGWLVLRRQGARGRVAEYALAIDQILHDTRASWASVGPDFELRLGHDGQRSASIVPLPVRGPVSGPDVSDGTEWSLAQSVVHAEDPGLYAAWVRGLAREGRSGARLTVRAPSRFHAAYVQTHLQARLLAACQTVDPDLAELQIIA